MTIFLLTNSLPDACSVTGSFPRGNAEPGPRRRTPCAAELFAFVDPSMKDRAGEQRADNTIRRDANDALAARPN